MAADYSSMDPVQRLHFDLQYIQHEPARSPEHFIQKVSAKTVTLEDIDWMARYASEKMGESFESVRKGIIENIGSMAALSKTGRTVADLGAAKDSIPRDIPLREKPAKKIDAKLNEVWNMLNEGVDIENVLESNAEDMDQEELRADFMPTDIFRGLY